ncbi:hypothetical protein EMCRGX_G025766 [Ephydatia muelleri]|eukprot:Em0021g530a
MRRYIMAVCGGLLASSCCVIQLVLNLFSFGCAGFNIVLQPYRPVLLSVVFGGLIYSFVKDFVLSPSCDVCSNPKAQITKYQAKKRFATTFTIAILLSFSPEILRVINRNPDVFIAPLHRLGPDRYAAVDGAKSCHLTSSDPKTTIVIRVEGMHCQACVNNAINALLALNPCAKVDLLVSGEGTIVVHADDAHVLTDRAIEEAVAFATFKAHVLRRETSSEYLT